MKSAARKSFLTIGALVVALSGLSPLTAAYAEDKVSCTGADTGLNDGYAMSANPWNTTGQICITSAGEPKFTVTTSTVHPGNPSGEPETGIRAYPRVSSKDPVDGGGRGLPLHVSELAGAPSSADTTQAAGRYNTAYDLWLRPVCNVPEPWNDPNGVELMVWLNKVGGMPAPAGGTPVQDFVLDGVTYKVRAKKLTGNHKYVIWYDRQQQTASIENLDLAKFVRNAQSQTLNGVPILQQDTYFCKAELGFEIEDKGLGNRVDSFSFQANKTPPVPAGTGFVTSGIPGKCVDDSSGAVTDGNPIISYRCNDTAPQRWTFGTDGTIKQSGKCLSVKDNATANDSKIVLNACTGASGQKWKRSGNAALENIGSGKCLDVPGASTANHIQLQIYTCNGSIAQRWRSPSPEVSGALGYAGLCADYDQWSGTDVVKAWDCNQSGPQTWTIGTNTIKSMGKCLTLTAGQIYNKPCDGSAAQSWVVTPTGNVANSGYDPAAGTAKCLRAPSTTHGTTLVSGDCAAAADQTWQLPA